MEQEINALYLQQESQSIFKLGFLMFFNLLTKML